MLIIVTQLVLGLTKINHSFYVALFYLALYLPKRNPFRKNNYLAFLIKQFDRYSSIEL